MILFVFAGFGAVGGGGVFTLDSNFHGIFALLSFISFNLLAIATVAILKGPMKAVSAVMGAIGLFALLLHALSDFGVMGLNSPIGPGGMEHIILFPALI